jgi:glutathione S-transferase
VLLRVTPMSPFGRKVRMAISHLGLWDRIETVKADPMDAADPLRRDNPLGKIPTLVTDDGKPVFHSRVILEYLDHIAGGGKLIPAAWPERVETLTPQAMCDGVMDVCILIIYEARHRPAALHHEPWLDYQRGKVVRGLAAFAKQPPDAVRCRHPHRGLHARLSRRAKAGRLASGIPGAGRLARPVPCPASRIRRHRRHGVKHGRAGRPT